MRTRIVSAFLAATIVLVGAATPCGAQTPPSAAAASAEAPVTGRALAELLRAYAALLPLDIRLDPKVSDIVVDADVAGLSPAAALREVLLASGVDYVMVRRGDRYSLVAGDASAAVDIDPVERPAEVPTTSLAAEPTDGEENRKGEPADDDPVPAPALTVATGGAGQRGAGVMSDADLLAALTTPAPARGTQGEWVTLPFPDENGQAVKTWRPAGKPSVIELPFTDSTGQPIIQVLPSRPVGYVELPFPDKDGQPLRQIVAPAAAPATSATTPGVVVGPKPPGDPLR